MLTELSETAKLSENLSWPIARDAFAMTMHRIEDKAVSWTDTPFLADNCLTYVQTASFNGSFTMTPCTAMNIQPNSMSNLVVCKWYNKGSYLHTQDHLNGLGLATFRHIFMYPFKIVKRNNNLKLTF